MKAKKALFIGRWQPFQKGYRWLIDQKLKQSIPVLIAVRDVASDQENPFTIQEVVEILKSLQKKTI
jgi:nicotinamide mononucleotide adenylyltransferase